MDKASEAILSLRPVTFHYKTRQHGHTAIWFDCRRSRKGESSLVLPDKEGKPYTVRYDAVNAMLLNEFLKEHRTVKATGIVHCELQKQIEALTAGLQKR